LLLFSLSPSLCSSSSSKREAEHATQASTEFEANAALTPDPGNDHKLRSPKEDGLAQGALKRPQQVFTGRESVLGESLCRSQVKIHATTDLSHDIITDAEEQLDLCVSLQTETIWMETNDFSGWRSMFKGQRLLQLLTVETCV
jgi:hypothetical protein